MNTIEAIDAERIKDNITANDRPKNILGKHFILVRQSDIVTQGARTGQPMRLRERRFLHILHGQADYRIDLMDYTVQQGDMVMMPPDTIVEVSRFSDDYALEALAVIDLPGIDHEIARRAFPTDVIHLALDEPSNHRIGGYFELIAQQLKREPFSEVAISHLILSMNADIISLQQNMGQQVRAHKPSRSEDIMAQFITLLRQYGTRERNIPFYANRLTLTPNHLSDVVRQQSGMSVMDWLHRTTTTEAKVLLKHSDLMIYEISERLNFTEPTAFNRYFKRQVGMTPLEYREE